MKTGDIYISQVDSYGLDKGEFVTIQYIERGEICFSNTDNDEWRFDFARFEDSFLPLQKDGYYNNDNGSLYLFAENHGLNAWEFDILKRVVRCRKKGQFKEDLEKTKRVIDLYLQEFNNQ